MPLLSFLYFKSDTFTINYKNEYEKKYFIYKTTNEKYHLATNMGEKSRMKKILKIENSPIETYQGEAFMLATLLAYDNTKNIVYNNYCNLQCKYNESSNEIELTFANSLWDYYQTVDIIKSSYYHVDEVEQDKFIDLIKESIDQDNYILLYQVDEFYLPYARDYNKNHKIHDTYVYGYEDNDFYVMAYGKQNLECFKVSAVDMRNAFYGNTIMEDFSFGTYRINPEIKIEINLQTIREDLYRYLHSEGYGTSSSNCVYGFQIYDVLMEFMRVHINKSDDRDFDLRVIRNFWEHKILMKKRIHDLREIIRFDDTVYSTIDEIEHCASILFLTSIRYYKNQQEHILNDNMNRILHIKEMEQSIIENIIDEIDHKLNG